MHSFLLVFPDSLGEHSHVIKPVLVNHSMISQCVQVSEGVGNKWHAQCLIWVLLLALMDKFMG